jgi:hypothetical protein
MKKIQNIQEIYDCEVELIKKQSSLLLQRKSEGFSGELKTSGLIVENYIKEIIKKHIPNGYRICSGYIATTESIKDTDNLAQYDLIIVDDRIPPIYKFGVSDIEIVAAESVCGIFEIKRTLTKNSLSNSVEHLKKSKETLDKYRGGIKSKMAQNNAAGPTMSFATCSPIYAIITLGAEKDEMTVEYIKSVCEGVVEDFLDMIWSMSDEILVRFALNKDGQILNPLTVSRSLEPGRLKKCEIHIGNEQRKGELFRAAISILRLWINNTAHAHMPYNVNMEYFGF